MADDIFSIGPDKSTGSSAGTAGTATAGKVSKGMLFDAVYTVDSNLNQDEFVRRAYINLAKSSFTPTVLDCTFDPVETSIMQVVGCSAHVDTSYKYDRVEYASAEIMEKETRRSGRSSYTVNVPKTIQVPQYIPENGRYSDDVEGYVFNLQDFSAVDNPENYLFYMDSHIPEIQRLTKRLAASGYDNLRLTDAAYIRSTHRCCDIANSNAPLPQNYDHITFNPVYYVNRVSCYMVPYYETAYRIGDNSYKAKGFACGDANVWQEVPSEGVGRANLQAKGEKETHLNGIKYGFPAVTWMLYVVAIVLSVIIGVNCFWTFVIPFVVYLAGLIAYKIASNRCNSYAANLNATWPEKMCSKLNEVFAAHGMRALTSFEQREFKQIDFTAEKRKHHDFSDISVYAAIVLVIFVITLFAVIFAAASILG